MCTGVFLACVRVSDLGVTDSRELPRGWWELNPGPLERAFSAEPSLQPLATLISQKECTICLAQNKKWQPNLKKKE